MLRNLIEPRIFDSFLDLSREFRRASEVGLYDPEIGTLRARGSMLRAEGIWWVNGNRADRYHERCHGMWLTVVGKEALWNAFLQLLRRLNQLLGPPLMWIPVP